MMLITGGSGFLGAALVREFAKYRAVRVLDILDDPGRPKGVGFVHGNLLDADAAKRACAGVEVVIHCAAAVPLTKDAARMHDVNVAGTHKIEEAAAYSGVSHFVHISSSAVYGDPVGGSPVSSRTPFAPADLYGESKLRAEITVRSTHWGSYPKAIIRPRTIIGPTRLGLFGRLFEWVRKGRPIPIFDGGTNVYQFVALADVVEAVRRVVEGRRMGSFNVGTEHFCSMRETLQSLIDHAGSRSRLVSVPMRPTQALLRWGDALGLCPFAPFHVNMYGRNFWFDIDEMRSRFRGWVPQIGHAQMFAEAYDWYLTNRDAQGNHSPHRRAL